MTIDTNPLNGAPIYLRDSQWSSKLFGGKRVVNAPKSKFSFLCGFIPNPNVTSALNLREIYDNMTFMIKSFDPPKVSFDTEVLDQYNKKRIIQRRMNHDPVTIRFHDDIGNKVFKMMYDYIRYYYKDSLNAEPGNWPSDVVKNYINEGNWGYTTSFQKNFFSSMYVAWINGGVVTCVSMKNPIINNINFDTLDYADDTPLEISISMDYEGFTFQEINVPVGVGGISDVERLIRDKLFQIDEIGTPGEAPDPNVSVFGSGRIPGLAEIFNDVSTFYGKYNGKPSIKDALDDYLIRPIKRDAVSSLSSWGDYTFGGRGAGSPGNLLSGVTDTIGSGYKYLKGGSAVTDVFSAGSESLGLSTRNSSFTNEPVSKANSFFSSVNKGLGGLF